MPVPRQESERSILLLSTILMFDFGIFPTLWYIFFAYIFYDRKSLCTRTCLIFWLWGYLMKVILRVPDEGYSERTWWRLFWAYLMKVILSVPDEGYSERTWWRLFWAYLMKVILSVPDEGYSECTWQRLFQKLVVHTNFDIYVFITSNKI